MDDRVGDVLAQRVALNGGAGAGIALSLLLHGGLSALAISAALQHAGVPVGGSGVIGLEGGDFPYTVYIDRMKTLIGTHWFRPQVGAGPTATVHFLIERDGRIHDAAVEAESGNGTFDRAALRAVLEA